MNNKITYQHNNISVANEGTDDVDSKRKQIQNEIEDYETVTLLKDSTTAQKQQLNNIKSIPSTEVEAIENLLNPSTIDITESNEAMTFVNNNEKQTSSRHLQHSYSTDFHHLYPNGSSSDGGQLSRQLDELMKSPNGSLLNRIKFLENENQKLVDKLRDQLSKKRDEKAEEDQLSSMKDQLLLQENTINDYCREAKLWKSKYDELIEKNQEMINKKDDELIKLKEENKLLKKDRDELQVDLERNLDENRQLIAENKKLNNKLFHTTAELEQIKKSTDSCELLRKDGIRSQQKCHVIAEKLETCKLKLEQSTNALKEKSCLVDQQNKEIKDLNANINDLKKVDALNQIEIERHKNNYEHALVKLKEKEELVNEYKTLYYEIKNKRENEVKHEQQTIKALIMINSKYELELAQVRADLEKLKYDQIVKSRMKPDLIEDNAEHDRINRLKKKYNILNNDDHDNNVNDVHIDENNVDVYEPDENDMINVYKADACKNGSNGDNNHGQSNGFIANKKKEAFKKLQNRNGNINSPIIKSSNDLNGIVECTHLSETALPS